MLLYEHLLPSIGAANRRVPILQYSISGLVVKSIVAIDGPRVRFAADAVIFLFSFFFLFAVLFNLKIDLSLSLSLSLFFFN
ncbi:hypothetical protein F5X96DRAFT_242161 [Biscogniauxia mediterranea]|nr:hypothetical protein F5X96DRAFT_242161 [Biscogniauxia mediterranea]